MTAVVDDDEPHTVTFEALAGGEPRDTSSGVADVLAALRHHGASELRVALPVPGDVLGLPGPPAFNAVAVQAAECVLAQSPDPDGPAFGIVPQVQAFGSVWEPGTLVAWVLHPTQWHRASVVAALAEADRELRGALVEATHTLASLDLARWRQDAAEQIEAVRRGVLHRSALPPSAPARAVAVLASAARVRAIVELATLDDGAAVTGWEADRRAEALRRLDAVARRAMVAAVNAALEPPHLSTER